MWALIPGPVRRALSWLMGALLFGLLMLGMGKRQERQKATTQAIKQEIKAHERITNADTGVGATDAERVKWLSRIADKWGNLPPQA
jgi:hypothetical protein